MDDELEIITDEYFEQIRNLEKGKTTENKVEENDDNVDVNDNNDNVNNDNDNELNNDNNEDKQNISYQKKYQLYVEIPAQPETKITKCDDVDKYEEHEHVIPENREEFDGICSVPYRRMNDIKRKILCCICCSSDDEQNGMLKKEN